jgi:hypothetical protein
MYMSASSSLGVCVSRLLSTLHVEIRLFGIDL